MDGVLTAKDKREIDAKDDWDESRVYSPKMKKKIQRLCQTHDTLKEKIT